eukprot:GHVT01105058.1.p1 GENE.GHVT01105058.1~~GHVT01105058.1.p1  ORF type:complete len:161 (-),score=22.40 GHVT01105058.1:43-525(-)
MQSLKERGCFPLDSPPFLGPGGAGSRLGQSGGVGDGGDCEAFAHESLQQLVDSHDFPEGDVGEEDAEPPTLPGDVQPDAVGAGRSSRGAIAVTHVACVRVKNFAVPARPIQNLREAQRQSSHTPINTFRKKASLNRFLIVFSISRQSKSVFDCFLNFTPV